MKTFLRTLALGGTALALGLGLTACELDDDNDDDHDVPEGKGSIIVDNNSADDIAVYIDGIRVENVDDYEDKAYDLDPGVHRVVLDQRSGDRNYRDDVDVIEGKRTVLDVSTSAFDSDEYDVELFFD